MSSINAIRILSGAMDAHEGHSVLRGALDPETLKHLLVDDYQRGVRPVASLTKIMNGFKQGSAVPDVELGMRGVKKSSREGVFTLHDPVYIIDGLQRIEAAKIFLANGSIPHLGATVHFGTTKEWERAQFKILNAFRVRVSSNVLFRNDKDDSTAVKMLFNLTHDDNEFVLCKRVSWDQRSARGELISAMMLGKVACMLHAHLTGMVSSSNSAEDLTIRVQRLHDQIGARILRDNIKAFFGILDECWGLKRVVYTEKATFIKATFLLTLARLLSNHEVFWKDEKRIFMEADLKRKLAQFPLQDPTVIQLASAGSKVDMYLYKLIVEHLNRGKRSKHLQERHAIAVVDEADEAAEADDGAVEAEAEAAAV